ncbi:pentapeptide repeat-containing protein [Candidatus Frankia alpina]|uniref:pentapeptide repeat-containing protein n=1 Tax=Candidatus Frankia alpina TaxID=2699483 RepID=UPI0013D38A9D|nr:pentapeptide repeat-containing protein [Candidatus Frankia alpina]
MDPTRKQRKLVGRYTAGIGQLGSEALDVRLDGIYALESLGAESKTYRHPVVEVLSAFVREHTIPDHPHGARRSWAAWSGRATSGRSASLEPPAPADQATSDTPLDLGRNPDTDVQAALTALGRLSSKIGISRAVPFSAWLHGMDRTGAWLCEVDLTGARLEGADLTEASLHGADLTEARLEGADLTGAQLTGADLTEASLHGADLTRAWLDEVDLTGARLEGADLTRVLLWKANLTRASLDGANLTEALLWKANLTRASLDGANLTDAQLDLANLTGARLDGANLTRACLDFADLTGVEGLTQTQVDVARGDEQTVLPAGITRPACWTESE